MPTLVSLAAGDILNLSAAELAVIQAAEDGREALPPTETDAEIGSRVIEWLCSNVAARRGVHRHGLAMRGFTINGMVDLIHADIPFPLQFRSCAFTQEFWAKSARLRSLTFRGCRLSGMNADSSSIDTNVLMIEGFQNVGEIGLRGAVIGGDLRTDGAVLSRGQACALVCDRAQIRGGVFLSSEAAISTYLGEVRFSGADVGGNIACDRAIFRNPEAAALSLERVRAGGSIFLRGCRIEGQVNLNASAVGAALDCRGASLQSSTGITLLAEKAAIGSHVLLDGQFACDGVHLMAATIQGGLRCRGARIGRLDLRHARVEGPFEWTGMINPSASSMDLRDTSLESIKDDEQSWPSAGQINLDGLRFERFSESVTDVHSRLRWLGLDRSTPAQSYWQLATVYERSGRADCAREVLYAFEKNTRSARPGLAAKAWDALLRWTIGYGYKLWRAAVLMGLLTAVGVGMALAGYYAKLIAPDEKDAHAEFVSTGGVPAQYPRFSASIYSIEHSLPGITLGVAERWSANTTTVQSAHMWAEPIIRCWFWIQSLLGWLLSIFFVAGLSGAVRNKK